MTARARLQDDDLPAALAECERLRAQVATLLSTQRQLSELLLSADGRAGAAMKLLVAVRSMIESRSATAAVASLRDILVNVIGADDFTIYATDPREQTLVPIASVGSSVRAGAPLPMDEGWLGALVRSGTLLIGHGRTGEARRFHPGGVEAVVPLRVLDRVVGVIVITSILPHREPLGDCDREILGLLGVYAATAIIAADRRSRWRQLPVVFR